MSLKDIRGPIKVSLITREWKPNLAFKLRLTAEQKRAIHAFHRMKLYKDRTGRPIQYYADPLATEEIRHLRKQIFNLTELFMPVTPAETPRMNLWITDGK